MNKTSIHKENHNSMKEINDTNNQTIRNDNDGSNSQRLFTP
jgi:hypothetical protein